MTTKPLSRRSIFLALDNLKVALSIESTRAGVLGAVIEAIDAKRKGYAVAINPEKIMRIAKDESLRKAVDQATICYADGVGICLAARIKGFGKVERYAGIDLFWDILEKLNERNGSLYLFGGNDMALTGSRKKIEESFPRVRIVGSTPGYGYDCVAVAREVISLSPDLVGVALGSPTQEKWISEYGIPNSECFFIGLGGTFDVISGRVDRAPLLFRKLGMEWIYRLIREPWRIKRQSALLRFAWQVARG